MIEELDSLIRVLHMRAGYEVVNHNSDTRQVRFIGRVPQDLVPAWRIIIRQLLLRSEATTWSIDVSKQYFLRGGKLMYGWRLIIQAPDISVALPEVAQTITGAPRPRQVVEEQPLVGRVDPKPGSFKGAAPAGKGVVGPKAIQQALNR